jgi:hypothetical protein
MAGLAVVAIWQGPALQIERPFIVSNPSEHRATSSVHFSESPRLYNYIQAFPVLRGLFADRRVCTLACDTQPGYGAPILVAVHGTWAARAGWVRRDSRLLMELARRWPAAGIYRFKWSGVNGARHRLVASDVLSEHLDRLASLYPSSKVIAISHSHGGNVVAWASTRVAQTLCAAVYLNTPFIQVLRSSKRSSLILRIVLYFGEMVLLSPILALSDILFPTKSVPNGIALGIGLVIMLAVLALTQRIVPGRIQVVRDHLVEASNGDRKISKELVVFVVGDEPSAAFSAVYLGQWLGRRAVILLIIAVFALGGLASFPELIPQSRADQLGPLLIGCCFAIYFVCLVFVTGAYGMVHGLVALDSSVTVTPAPIGQADFVTVGWTSQDRLRHSLIYESSEAIAVIVKWLDAVLGAGADMRS